MSSTQAFEDSLKVLEFVPCGAAAPRRANQLYHPDLKDIELLLGAEGHVRP